MQLNGYLKLTLQDDPGHMAAICFTRGCQLRCPYCHNPDLVLAAAPDRPDREDDFFAYLARRRDKLDSVVISGGEPLLQPDLPDFISKIRSLGLRIKLDTNGQMPDRLEHLLSFAAPDYVALDYKNCRESLAVTCGLVSGYQPACAGQSASVDRPASADELAENWRQSLRLLRRHAVDHELRTTVVREYHPLAALHAMARELADEGADDENWYLQTFSRSGPLIADAMQLDLNMTAYQALELAAIRRELAAIMPGVQLRQ